MGNIDLGRQKYVWLVALLLTLALVAVDELHQASLPGRSAGGGDFALDPYRLWVLMHLGSAR